MKINKILILLASVLFSTGCLANEKLIFAIDLVRHGDRTPGYEIPKSAYNWNGSFGELTEKGETQLLQLGKKFRQIYINQEHLLPEQFDPNLIYVRSTQVPRTIGSARSLLQGLYPNASIKINSVPRSQDELLIVKPNFNPLSLINLHLEKRKLWKQYTNPIQNKMKYWSEATGIPINNLDNLDKVADNLFVCQQHNIAYPKGISEKDADEIIALDEKLITSEFKLSELTQPMGRRFLSTVRKYLTEAKNKATVLRYVLYSGHDATIMAVMNTLGAPLDKTPAYASDLNFSLYENGSKYYVKITFNNKPVNLAQCNNTNVCTLNDFKVLK